MATDALLGEPLKHLRKAQADHADICGLHMCNNIVTRVSNAIEKSRVRANSARSGDGSTIRGALGTQLRKLIESPNLQILIRP